MSVDNRPRYAGGDASAPIRSRSTIENGFRGVPSKEDLMNWDEVQGNWKQLKGAVREKWGDLTDDDLDRIAGKRDQFVGRLQERYGMTREEAERNVDEFVRDAQYDRAAY